MELNLGERIVLLGMLPEQHNLVTMRIVKELQMNLGFTEEEIKEYNISVDTEKNIVKWDIKGNIPKDIKIGEKAHDIIMEQFAKLDKENKLKAMHIELYDKFGGK